MTATRTSARRTRTGVPGLLSALAVTAGALTAGAVTAAPAHAVAGGGPADATYAYTAKLDIGPGRRACTGTLVDQQWLLTAASCFADDPATGKVTAGAPRWKTTATIGRADLSAGGGSVVEVVELVPRTDRDLVLARLAAPVTGTAPVRLATAAPRAGEQLTALGYGRTADEWVPDRLRAGAFVTGEAAATTVPLEPTAAGTALCKGDNGGPALRETDGSTELVAVTSRSWAGGCLGSGTETRKGAVSTRVDDIADWVRTTTFRGRMKGVDWKTADLLASGYFTGGSAGGKRHMDLLVRWTNGSVSLFQGSETSNPETPFSARYELAKADSVWKHARAISGGEFTSGGDGLFVRWSDGEVTQYGRVDQKGFHQEKMLAKTEAWKQAKLATVGRFNGGTSRDDLMVVWDNGTVSLYPDLDTNGLKKENQIVKTSKTWTYAEQIGAAEFTGGRTSDLMVRWKDGETTIYPAVDEKGFHGETKIREPKSPWIDAKVLTVGAFTTNKAPNDVLVRWTDGKLTLHPKVDAAGLHSEVRIND
ncbi:S1 family peptidase [Streptomyces sp. LP05-1]|uniref:S1 family peptidase n=1 Tax=Streptomyces pyxinae TaxID=2970734 RepID=A0ABT2C9Q7_9ACTN|nr:S1 family peptidase [Streptomyces sp. LP05-1]MCS0634088.1 S1 family peptidase [Streptomyces sp. LP05-1]